jgi:hypothetical protein
MTTTALHEELLMSEDSLPAHLTQLDASQVEPIAQALAAIAHYAPSLRSEAGAFAVSRTIHDGHRALNLGRHIETQLQAALADLEQLLPKS